ncbi:hypothetical protein, partial [uncultured Intestinimonas sp.]|uniref:hypothetical protein n=1 Tax=uncultured Intestinimonas sp. TaxID=1689265 RepID=UPI0025D8FF7F
ARLTVIAAASASESTFFFIFPFSTFPRFLGFSSVPSPNTSYSTKAGRRIQYNVKENFTFMRCFW